MSERKVLNKYYPPDFDPTKIPKLRLKKNGNFGIRLMAPFNMRCNTCGEYIYKGKKFNSQKETVADKNYLGLHIFRFYIKCPRCIAVIAFRTDPETTDYVLEAGATRNFEALRTAEQLAAKEAREKEEELKNNPMKVLENRSLKSQQEIEAIENLEELMQIKKKQNNTEFEDMLKQTDMTAEEKAKKEEEEDEEFIRSQFRGIKRLVEPNGKEEEIQVKKKEKLTASDFPKVSNSRQKDTLKSIKIIKKPKDQSVTKESTVSSTSNPAPSSVKSVPSNSAPHLMLGLVGYDDSDNDESD